MTDDLDADSSSLSHWIGIQLCLPVRLIGNRDDVVGNADKLVCSIVGPLWQRIILARHFNETDQTSCHSKLVCKASRPFAAERFEPLMPVPAIEKVRISHYLH